MKISQKLVLALVVVSLPLALISLVVTVFIQREIGDLGEFHSPNLTLIQTIGSEVLAAVEESFAYVASGKEEEKQHFFQWAKGFAARMGEFQRTAELERQEEAVEHEIALARKILLDQRTLVENAEAMFRQYESAGKLSESVFSRYEDAVNRLRTDIDELVRHEKAEVDGAQARAIQVIKRSEAAIIFLAVLSATSAIVAGFFISRAICRPISELQSASGEISRGNFDVKIACQSKDEIGDLARSIFGMAQDLSKRREELQLRYKELQALREIDQAIMSTLDLRTVLDALLKKIDLVLPYSATTIRLFDKTAGMLEPMACWNVDEKEWRAQEWRGGRGIPNVVFETKAPRIVRNVQVDPNIRDPDFFRRHGLVSYLGVPLIVQENILGVISFYTKEEHEFSDHDIQFLTALAGQAAIAIQNSQLFEETVRSERQLKEAYKHLESIFKVTVTSSESLDLEATLKEAIRQFTEVFDFDSSEIFILNRQTEALEMKASFGSPLTQKDRSFRLGEGIVGTVAEDGEALVFEDIRNDPRYQQWSETKGAQAKAFRFFAVFPIRSKHGTVGVIVCIGRSPRSLTPNELQALSSITAQLGITVENATLYQEALHRNQELEKALKVKDEFLSVMSHELRTPLNVVLGYAGMIQDGVLGEVNPAQQDACVKITRRTDDLLSIVNSILYATSLETGEIKVAKDDVSLKDLLGELRAAYEIPLDMKVALNWDYGDDLPIIKSDGAKLKYILQNLIDNAVKFTERGSVTVSARAGKSRVKFKVADTGIGIPNEMQSAIFEKFRQVDSSETRIYGGVGLGLYVAKQFTEMLGGTIAVESEVGKGSTFMVRLPLSRQATGYGKQVTVGDEERGQG